MFMYKFRLALVPFTALIFALPSSAQETAQEDAQGEAQVEATQGTLKPYNVGIAAGFISGYGLTYRHWRPTGNGYQLVFVPLGRIDENNADFNSSLGILGLRSLHRTGRTNFFAYYGGHYNFKFERRLETRYNFSGTILATHEREEVAHNLFGGGGAGVELHFWNLNFNLMFGYAAHGRMRQTYYTGSAPSDVGMDDGDWHYSFQFQPSVETALFYSF